MKSSNEINENIGSEISEKYDLKCAKNGIIDGNKTAVIKHQEMNTLIDEKHIPRNTEHESKFSILKGLIYPSLSGVLFSLCSVIVKYLDNIHPTQLALFRFIGITLLSLPHIAFNRLNPFGSREMRHILILRGLCGGVGLLLIFYCIQNIPISEASVIVFSFPVTVTIMAKIFLKERFGIFQTFILLLTMIGLILITRLPLTIIDKLDTQMNNTSFNNSTHSYSNSSTQIESQNDYSRIIGISTGMLSTVFASLVFILLRMANKAHPAVIAFNLGWAASGELFIITAFLNGYSLPIGIFNWSLICLLALFSYCGQFLLAESLKLENCSPIAVIRATVDILLSFMWQFFLFEQDKFDIWSISGGLIVASCIILTTFRRHIISLPEGSDIRQKFNFVIA